MFAAVFFLGMVFGILAFMILLVSRDCVIIKRTTANMFSNATSSAEQRLLFIFADESSLGHGASPTLIEHLRPAYLKCKKANEELEKLKGRR